MKEKSFGGVSEMALGSPSRGEMGDGSERVGDRTRVGMLVWGSWGSWGTLASAGGLSGLHGKQALHYG